MIIYLSNNEQIEVNDFDMTTHKFDFETRRVVEMSETEKTELANVQKKEMERLNALSELSNWFRWYDNQVFQAQRAERTGTVWQAVYGDKTYRTLAELDSEANAKQVKTRELQSQNPYPINGGQ